jgi:hypothetical protein
MTSQTSRCGNVIAAFVFILSLSACDDDQQSKKPNQTLELIKQETALMSDLDRAGPELESRLAQRVRVDGGLILVNAAMGMFVLPTSTQWTLQCSPGITIVFGNSVHYSVSRGETSEDYDVDTGNDVVVSLTIGDIDPKACNILGPRIGRRLLAILNDGKSVAGKAQ